MTAQRCRLSAVGGSVGPGSDGRRDRELEPVGVLQPKYAPAGGHVGGLRLKSATAFLDPIRKLVDVLIRRDQQGRTPRP